MSDDKKQDEKELDDDIVKTYVVNLTTKPITVRVDAEKTVVTEEYTKLYKSVEERVQKSHGIGVNVGVPEVGDIGVKFDESKESENKTKDLQEDYRKLEHYLKTAGFVTIAAFRSLAFATKEKINYVTIFVGGKKMKGDKDADADNWNIDVREIYVDHDGTIGTNEKVTIAPYYNDDLFSHAYQASMVDALNKFKDLYKFAKSHDGKIVLQEKTVHEIAQCGIDFIGMNLATSEVLSVVAQRWFGDSVKRLYAFGIDIEKMPVKQVAFLLTEISEQAKDLSNGWEQLAAWYMQMSSQIGDTQSDVKSDDEAALRKVKELKREKQDALDAELRNQKKYSQTEKIAAGIFTFGIASYFMSEHNKRMDAITNKYRKQIEDAVRNQASVSAIVARIGDLADSLQDMMRFCNLMATYFQKQYQNFKSWGETHSQKASDISYISWSPQKCATWIIDLDRNSYQKYEADIMKKFIKTKKDGAKLKDINASWLEDVCDVEEADAQAMAAQIGDLTVKGDVQYKYVKKIWDDDVEWMQTQQKSISSVNAFLLKLQIDASFIEKNVVPTERKPVVLTTFGNLTISPQESAAKLVRQ